MGHGNLSQLNVLAHNHGAGSFIEDHSSALIGHNLQAFKGGQQENFVIPIIFRNLNDNGGSIQGAGCALTQ